LAARELFGDLGTFLRLLEIRFVSETAVGLGRAIVLVLELTFSISMSLPRFVPRPTGAEDLSSLPRPELRSEPIAFFRDAVDLAGALRAALYSFCKLSWSSLFSAVTFRQRLSSAQSSQLFGESEPAITTVKSPALDPCWREVGLGERFAGLVKRRRTGRGGSEEHPSSGTRMLEYSCFAIMRMVREAESRRKHSRVDVQG